MEEVGTSEILFLVGTELATPPLGGTILSGFTGHSVIKLARHWGIEVTKQPIPIEEVVDGCTSGRLREVFVAGTAAVISLIGEIWYHGSDLKVGIQMSTISANRDGPG
jgi:branched-chain amino acid aminotransferase